MEDAGGQNRIGFTLEKRVETYMAAIAKADDEKGEKTLYTVNITDGVERLRDNALRAIRAGANALMVNYVATGLSALRMLAEDPEVNVPILAHATAGGSGHVAVSPWSQQCYCIKYALPGDFPLSGSMDGH